MLNFQKNFFPILLYSFIFFLTCFNACVVKATALTASNFGLPGTIETPSGYSLKDGEIILTQQIHESLSRAQLSFQTLPFLGLTFRYSGHGIGGGEAYGRVNHDRSFDAHITLSKEGKFFPSISLGLRDFIGTGWYSSEYVVGTKTIGDLKVSMGLGFGRLAGKSTFKNPLTSLSSKFIERNQVSYGTGGSINKINWFRGPVSPFLGFRYELNKKISLMSEYSPDLMQPEASYIEKKSHWNVGASYQINDYITLSGQYLHGSKLSFTANLMINPTEPPYNSGKELAPVPMRLRGEGAPRVKITSESTIKRVLEYDKFEIIHIKFTGKTVRIDLINKKFRSPAQAIGRVSSTLQRFTADTVQTAIIVFHNDGLQIASYSVDLENITMQQFSKEQFSLENKSIIPLNSKLLTRSYKSPNHGFNWGIGPYITHRFFNPDLPFSAETGLELRLEYRTSPNLKLSSSFRKSILTNLTENKRRSGSALPKVHSNWPLYDLAGQDGHIHNMTVEYKTNFSESMYSRVHLGLLEPFYAGIGGEFLYYPKQSSFAMGIDIHYVKQRDYDMMFDTLDYETALGHFSFYADAIGLFDLEINVGKYLAGDWGATTRISRAFDNGWEVGGYATLTDVPFEIFGEGSFDKGIFMIIPMDWVLGTPNQSKRRFTIRPITRDGGAQLSSSRSLYRQVRKQKDGKFFREIGRLWK